MNTSVIQRVKEFSEYIGLNETELANRIGLSQRTVNNYMNGSRKLSFEFVDSLVRTFELNSNWLITGKGEMYNDLQSNAITISNTEKINQELTYKPRPYIDSVYGSLGIPNGFALAVKADECEKISIPFIRDYDFSIRGRGDSMINRNNPERSINDGDVIACKLWTSRSHIRWGSVYALSTTEGVIVKKIVKSERDGYIKCVPFNIEDGYSPYDIPIEEVFDWAIVVSVISICNWN